MTAPDARPERVQCFIPTSGMIHLVAGADAGYVKWDDYAALESRLLAAEARVREVEAEQDALRQLKAAYEVSEAKSDEQYATLRAERDALLPLARFAMRVHDTGDNTADAAVADGVLVWVRDSECDESPAFTQARSILAREET